MQAEFEKTLRAMVKERGIVPVVLMLEEALEEERERIRGISQKLREIINGIPPAQGMHVRLRLKPPEELPVSKVGEYLREMSASKNSSSLGARLMHARRRLKGADLKAYEEATDMRRAQLKLKKAIDRAPRSRKRRRR